MGTKECACGVSWSNWWHMEDGSLLVVHLSVLPPGVFCSVWLAFESKSGVTSVNGLYRTANGFLFSPNAPSLTTERLQDAEGSPKALVLTRFLQEGVRAPNMIRDMGCCKSCFRGQASCEACCVA